MSSQRNASEGHVSAFANLPISRKLIAAFSAVVVVIFVSSAIVYDRLRVIEWAKNQHVQTTDVLEALQAAMDAMVEQETGVRGYLITGEEKFLEPYHRGGNAYTAAIQKIKTLTSDEPAQQSRLDEINGLASKWRSEIAERETSSAPKWTKSTGLSAICWQSVTPCGNRRSRLHMRRQSSAVQPRSSLRR
jgi:CHASE3 domain sensor protein